MSVLQESSFACYTEGRAHCVDNWRGLSTEPEGDGEDMVYRMQ